MTKNNYRKMKYRKRLELHLLVMYHFTKVIQKCTKLFFNHYLNAKEYGKCIVDIDEFQQIEYYPEKNMEAILRTYIQHCSNDNFIFSGSERHIISKMFSEKAHPFYNSADIMNLEVIPLDKYTEFCEKLFHKFDKEISKEAIAKVYEIFDGNTYYIQKVVHEAFNLTDISSEATEKLMGSVIHSMILDNDHKFSELLSRLSLHRRNCFMPSQRMELQNNSFLQHSSKGTPCALRAACRVHSRNCSTFISYQPRKLHTI